MSTLSVEFAFDIGDFVYYRDALNDRHNRSIRFMVVERCAQECHGGVQRQYRLSDNERWVAEILLSKEPPPFEPWPDERIKEEARVDDLRREFSSRPIKWYFEESTEKVKRDPPGGEA